MDDIDEAEDRRPFIVMELIEGRSLKEVIQHEAPMALGRACSIAKQVAGALQSAHGLQTDYQSVTEPPTPNGYSNLDVRR